MVDATERIEHLCLQDGSRGQLLDTRGTGREKILGCDLIPCHAGRRTRTEQPNEKIGNFL